MRFLKFLLIFILSSSVLGAAAVAAVLWHFSQDLPSTEGLEDFRLQVPLRIYSADDMLIGEYGAERREPLRYEDLPQDLIHAFLAAEDDRFFQHPGVDYQGILRAIWVLATTGEKAQGGSTITMQLARNFFLSAEKSYVRKIREILLALKMEQQLSKEEILTFYVNKIFLGHRAYGVGAAAKVYYGQDLADLSLSQLAMIAGLPKAPSRYNPISGPKRALLRRNYVLRRMHELNYITAEQFAAAKEEPISASLRQKSLGPEANYVAEYARSRVINQFGTDAYTSGIVVRTTIDSRKQAAAVAALRHNLREYDKRQDYRGAEAHFEDLPQALTDLPGEELVELLDPLLEEFDTVGGLIPAMLVAVDESTLKVYSSDTGFIDMSRADQAWTDLDLRQGDLLRLAKQEEAPGWALAQIPEVQGAIVSIDPQQGAVQALVGGFDYFASKFNRAMQAQRQPGSSFKPFVYSAALENGFTPASIINDAPVVFDDAALGGAWRPQNYSGRFYGPTPLREGLAKSRNLVAIRVADSVGVGTVRNFVTRFGFDRDRVPRDLSMPLGSGVFSPLEMATAYAVLANGGYKISPYLIEQIIDSDGEVLHQARPATVCDAVCLRQRESEAEVAALEASVSESMADAADDSSSERAAEGEGEQGPPPVAERVLSPANAYIMTDMLRDVIQYGTARRARSLGRSDLAGKTGTTNDQRDAWFCGFNAQEVAVAWVGFDDVRPLGSRETGGRAALPMWMDYMKVALEGVPERRLKQPDSVVSARINPETGLLASYDNPNAKFEIFMAGRLPEMEESTYMPAASSEPGASPRQNEEELIEDLF